jgi:hypothetical protein
MFQNSYSNFMVTSTTSNYIYFYLVNFSFIYTIFHAKLLLLMLNCRPFFFQNYFFKLNLILWLLFICMLFFLKIFYLYTSTQHLTIFCNYFTTKLASRKYSYINMTNTIMMIFNYKTC